MPAVKADPARVNAVVEELRQSAQRWPDLWYLALRPNDPDAWPTNTSSEGPDEPPAEVVAAALGYSRSGRVRLRLTSRWLRIDREIWWGCLFHTDPKPVFPRGEHADDFRVSTRSDFHEYTGRAVEAFERLAADAADCMGIARNARAVRTRLEDPHPCAMWTAWLHQTLGIAPLILQPEDYVIHRYAGEELGSVIAKARQFLKRGPQVNWYVRRLPRNVFLASVQAIETSSREDQPHGKVAPGSERLTAEEKALALLVNNPKLSDTQIATAVGVNRTTLYKPNWWRYRNARKALKSGRDDLARGSKDRDTGRIEAWKADPE